MAKRISQADLDVQITADDLIKQERLLERMPVEMNRYLTTAVRKGSALVKGTEVPRVKRFSGSTADSIKSSVRVKGIGSVTGVIGPDRKRAHIFRIMQSGRAAGAKQPWVYDLLEWVEKKWGSSSLQDAYRLARSIHEKGIEGTPIAKPVIEETRNRILGLIKEATDKIVKGLVVK